MAKKLGSFRILSCTLAVLATVAFIVACGSGVTDDIENLIIKESIKQATGRLVDEDVLSSIVERPSSAFIPASSSSEGGDSAGSGGDDSSDSGGGTTSSSNVEQPSSSSTSPGVSSPSQLASSSSGVPLYTPECNILNSTFPSGTKIPIDKRPEIKCKVIATGEVITLHNDNDVGEWTNAPGSSLAPWSNPAVGTYNNILVKIDREKQTEPRECQGMEVKCNGIITITAPPSSSSVYIPPPPSSNSNTPSSNSNTPSSSSSKPASSSSAAQSGSGDYCYYGEGNCHKMPTNDNCAGGVLVNSCNNASVQYCDYGVCQGGNKWDCSSGGCYVKKGDCGNGASIVTTCPSDHLSPCGKNPDGPGCKD